MGTEKEKSIFLQGYEEALRDFVRINDFVDIYEYAEILIEAKKKELLERVKK